VDEVELTFDGIPSDMHAGIPRRSGSREPWYQRGTVMRNERQVTIVAADELAAAGIKGAFEGASSYAANKQMVGRTHFARWLVAQGHAPDMRTTFKRYLTRGNPGYVEHEWTSLENAVGWIHASGGMAVIAHPGRYVLNARQLHLLLDAFRALGGEGIEVITGSHHPSEYGKFADLARAFSLKASRGADFHAPDEGVDIGRLPALPHYCQPVWFQPILLLVRLP
jgi:predicted metal-dependent phosphoesterase TrpH